MSRGTEEHLAGHHGHDCGDPHDGSEASAAAEWRRVGPQAIAASPVGTERGDNAGERDGDVGEDETLDDLLCGGAGLFPISRSGATPLTDYFVGTLPSTSRRRGIPHGAEDSRKDRSSRSPPPLQQHHRHAGSHGPALGCRVVALEGPSRHSSSSSRSTSADDTPGVPAASEPPPASQPPRPLGVWPTTRGRVGTLISVAAPPGGSDVISLASGSGSLAAAGVVAPGDDPWSHHNTAYGNALSQPPVGHRSRPGSASSSSARRLRDRPGDGAAPTGHLADVTADGYGDEACSGERGISGEPGQRAAGAYSSSLLRATMAAEVRYGHFAPKSPTAEMMMMMRQQRRWGPDGAPDADAPPASGGGTYSDDVMWRILHPHPELAGGGGPTLRRRLQQHQPQPLHRVVTPGDSAGEESLVGAAHGPRSPPQRQQALHGGSYEWEARSGAAAGRYGASRKLPPAPEHGYRYGYAVPAPGHRERWDPATTHGGEYGSGRGRPPPPPSSWESDDAFGAAEYGGRARGARPTRGASSSHVEEPRYDVRAPATVAAPAANAWLLPSYSPTSFVRAYVGGIGSGPLEATLHPEPALIVGGCTTLMSVIIGFFLQNHVLDTRDHIALFAVGTYIVFSSYYMIYYFLERYSTSFRKISQDKKFYTIGNLIKAGVLISITPFAVIHLTRIVLFNKWDANTLRNLGCIYAIPDFVSMIVVKRMAWSTWVHHLCVVVFNYFSVMNDYEQENVCRLVVVYAAFSTFAYCVNLLLASRFLGVTPRVARVLSFVALVVYVLCCAVNWTWQVYYLRRLLFHGHEHWTVYLYMMLICFVMWDDIVLNKWLLQNARNTSSLAAAAAAAANISMNSSGGGGGGGGSHSRHRCRLHHPPS